MSHINPQKCKEYSETLEKALKKCVNGFFDKYNDEILNKPTRLVFELNNDPLAEITNILSHLNSDQLQTLYNNRDKLLIELEKQLLLKI